MAQVPVTLNTAAAPRPTLFPRISARYCPARRSFGAADATRPFGGSKQYIHVMVSMSWLIDCWGAEEQIPTHLDPDICHHKPLEVPQPNTPRIQTSRRSYSHLACPNLLHALTGGPFSTAGSQKATTKFSIPRLQLICKHLPSNILG